jgi:hypothetical protein
MKLLLGAYITSLMTLSSYGSTTVASQYQEIEGIVGNFDSSDVELIQPNKSTVKVKRWEIDVKNIKSGCPVVAVVSDDKLKKAQPSK